MDKKYLERYNLLEAREKYQRILEYISPNSFVEEEGDEEQSADPSMGGGMPPMGGGPNAMGGDPSMGGGMSPMGGVDPNATGADPSMGGGPNAMGDPSMDGQGQTPEGLAPQGGEMEQLGATADTDPNAGVGDDEEVIDVDDLTNSQEATEEKIDRLSDKFEKLMGMLDSFESRIDASNERMESLRSEIEKRNPSPVEKMSLRSTKSSPYGETPEEWWANNAPENYSPEDDNNGAHDPQYQITKSDIDNISDWGNIAKSMNDDNLSIKDMFDF